MFLRWNKFKSNFFLISLLFIHIFLSSCFFYNHLVLPTGKAAVTQIRLKRVELFVNDVEKKIQKYEKEKEEGRQPNDDWLREVTANFKKLPKKMRTNYYSLFYLGKAYKVGGKYRSAIRVYGKILKLSWLRASNAQKETAEEEIEEINLLRKKNLRKPRQASS